jgi:hypothetical protein
MPLGLMPGILVPMTTKVSQDDTDSNNSNPNLQRILRPDSDVSSVSIDVWDDGVTISVYFEDGGLFTTERLTDFRLRRLKEKGVLPEEVEV